MGEEYVTLETARLAKDLGFNKVCRTWYEDFGSNKSFEPISPANYNDERVFVKTISRPTQTVLQKWLREEKGVEVIVVPDEKIHKKYVGYYVNHWRQHKKKEHISEYVLDRVDIKNDDGIQIASYQYEHMFEVVLKKCLQSIEK